MAEAVWLSPEQKLEQELQLEQGHSDVTPAEPERQAASSVLRLRTLQGIAAHAAAAARAAGDAAVVPVRAVLGPDLSAVKAVDAAIATKVSAVCLVRVPVLQELKPNHHAHHLEADYVHLLRPFVSVVGPGRVQINETVAVSGLT